LLKFRSNSSEINDGIIIILGYPDTIVRPAYWENSSKVLYRFGIGGEHAIKAGHSALLLLKKGQTHINYFDFGRYITSYGFGRVRSIETDPEVTIPIKAIFSNAVLSNEKEILLWLENNSNKTHGKGRMIAGLHEKIDYQKALNFINHLIQKKEIPYGAFLKNGSNCARFVRDTILASSNDVKVNLLLKKSKLITPSPIGNVIKGTTNKIIFSVEHQKISIYSNRFILKELMNSIFKTIDIELCRYGNELPNSKYLPLKNATWLGGIGSGAWFHIEEQLNANTFRIARYNNQGKKDFENIFISENSLFNIRKKHQFIYPTNCKEVFLTQNNFKFNFKTLIS
jgi:hypothetical protein